MTKFNTEQRESLITLAQSFLDATTPERKNDIRVKLQQKLKGTDMSNLETLCEEIIYEARARNQGGLHW